MGGEGREGVGLGGACVCACVKRNGEEATIIAQNKASGWRILPVVLPPRTRLPLFLESVMCETTRIDHQPRLLLATVRDQHVLVMGQRMPETRLSTIDA